MNVALLGFGVVGRGVYDLVKNIDGLAVTKVVCLEDVQLPDATVTKDFTENGFLSALMGFRRYLTSRPFLISVGVFVVMLLAYLRMTTGPGGRYGIRSVRRRRVNYVKRRY